MEAAWWKKLMRRVEAAWWKKRDVRDVSCGGCVVEETGASDDSVESVVVFEEDR